MKRSLPLIAVLSALALGASVVRTAAQWQVIAMVGGPFTVNTLILIEIGNWIGWTAWAVLLALAMHRISERSRLGPSGIAAIVGLGVAPMFVVPVLSSPWHWLVTDSAGVFQSASHIVGHNFPTNLLLAVAMLAVAQGMVGRERTSRLERTAADLRAQLAESQLATLRAQLDPHFLFNALNSVAVLARRGEMARVDAMVAHLSALLRHSLETGRAQQVPLRVELEALRHYLDIELVRHGDRLDVRWDVAPALEDRIVPSFVLQPLVENAVRHGFTDPERALRVAVGAREADGALVLTVADDGDGLTMGDRERPAEGIGLGHTRARLAGLYGDAAQLEIAPGDGGRGARVTITIPARAR